MSQKTCRIEAWGIAPSANTPQSGPTLKELLTKKPETDAYHSMPLSFAIT